MQTRQVPLYAPHAPADTCRCDLETIVRPRFYCGQLLTDLDMSALVDWGRRRWGLTRLRDGWGVVCGLDLRTTRKVASSVTIGPGYAVGCGGDDIVVPEDFALDLAPIAADDRKRCLDLGVAQATELLIDIFLGYSEEDADPHAAFARSCCAEAAVCENSRTREGYHAYGRKAPSADDPVATAANAWLLGYEACLGVIKAYRHSFKTFPAGQVAALRTWFREWLAEHPSREEWALLAEIDATAAPTEKDVAGWLFRLAQEARNAYLTGPCPAAESEVRLARVTLKPAAGNSWAVHGIDLYPPYRRPLRTDAWPAPMGSVNVAQMVWHRWSEACTRFADLGVEVAGTTDFPVPVTIKALEGALDCRPFVPCATGVTVELYGPDRRVVGFCGKQEPEVPTTPLKLSVVKTSALPVAVPGGSTRYRVTVTNNDDVEMTVTVDDAAAPAGLGARTVPKGGSVDFDYEVRVPSTATGTVVNTATATAVAGARTGSGSDTLALSTLRLLFRKTGPEKARAGEEVTFTFTVTNTSAVDVDVELVDSTLGVVGRRTVAAGGTTSVERRWTVPSTASGTVTNKASVSGSINGQVLVHASDDHTVVVSKDLVDGDLTRIDGIGGGRARALRDGGITGLAELATAEPDRIRALLPGVSVTVIEQWIRAAQEAIA